MIVCCVHLVIERVLFVSLIDRIKRDIAEPQTVRVVRMSPSAQLWVYLML